MSQDYTELYGKPRMTAPPVPNPYLQDEGEKEDEAPPKPFVMDSSEVQPMPLPRPVQPPQPFPMRGNAPAPQPFPMPGNGVTPQPAPQPYIRQPGQVPPMYQPPAYAYPTRKPEPAKPRQPFSPIPLLLIAGVAFLFLGGVIFLTNTWDALPAMARALSLLSVGVISFGVHVLAEKAFKLPKTAIAFYILGCIFLPMAVAGIGAFSLFGEWFSFTGGGSDLVWASCFACAAGTTAFGAFRYKQPFLAWLSLAGMAAAYFFLDAFLLKCINFSIETELLLFGAVITVFCIGATVWSEWCLRRHPDSPYSKAAIFFLYLVILGAPFTFGNGVSRLATTILPVVIIALSLNKRFVWGKLHGGVFPIVISLFMIFGTIGRLGVFKEAMSYLWFLFSVSAPALLLLACFVLPEKWSILRKNCVIAGAVMSLPMLVTGTVWAFFTDGVHLFAMLAAMLMASGVCFLAVKKNRLPKDAPLLALFAMLLFDAAALGSRIVPARAADAVSMGDGFQALTKLLLVMGALLLLADGFLTKRVWCFVLAVTACGAMALLHLDKPFLWILLLCTAVTLGGVVYAHLAKRPLLEKCAAWVFIPLLVTAGFSLMGRDHLGLPYAVGSILMLAVVTLLYLLESVALCSHARTQNIGTVLYLEVLSAAASLNALASFLWNEHFRDPKIGAGFGCLLALLLCVFTVTLTRKKINLWAIPYLVMLFAALNYLVQCITPMQMTGWGIPDPELAADLIHAGCYILVLAGFALMGRILLPKFCSAEGGLQIDLPLLAGVLLVIAAAVSIDWYPLLLMSLFMTVYSLLFIGRLQNRRIPALLASLFGCTTVFLHNVYDPFGVLEKLSLLDIKTVQILLYLLPVHLFIFTLLFILPDTARPGVHIARFVMYCVTMLCLLISSLWFGNVADALVLVIFSLGILVGSFVVKRLRWFTLGFAVLVTTTIRLTWSFWTSLHWGIYLFLAGIILIVLASLYEYSARYAREHPDEPKKFRMFAQWHW